MAQLSTKPGSRKRKLVNEDAASSNKKPVAGPRPATLTGPHEAIIEELDPKYNILPASIISSSKIQQRTTSATRHLLSVTGAEKPTVVLLHARTDCLSKLVTVVETVKRVLTQEGKNWWQYNQMYEQTERPKNHKDVVEETILSKDNPEDGEEEEETYFETMGTRLEQAILPKPKTKAVKSLRVFLATSPVPELKAKTGIGLQTSSDAN